GFGNRLGDIGIGGKVKRQIGALGGAKDLRIVDIVLAELKSRIGFMPAQMPMAAGGKIVVDDQSVRDIVLQEVVDDVAADEAGPAENEHLHERSPWRLPAGAAAPRTTGARRPWPLAS